MKLNTKNRTNTHKKHNTTYIMYGKHACIEALQNRSRIIHEIYTTKELYDSYKHIINNHANISILENKDFDKLFKEHIIHQGIALRVEKLHYTTIHDITHTNKTRIVILDHVTDTHNLGAIIRSAAAFDIKAIITAEDNSPDENATVAKSACGGLEKISWIKVTNISHSIKELKKLGFWVIGLDGSGKDVMTKTHFDFEKVAIVMGSEDKGMRRLTQENCDIIVKIPISSNMESINVSNAASIAFYTASKEV